jgi:hypothetical protein
MTTKTVRAFSSIRNVAPVEKGEKNQELPTVQEFLQRFGYLDEGAFHPGELDDATSEALKNYQRLNGRRPVGTFNKATREQMTTHRCGLPDMGMGVAFSTLCSWDKPVLTFAFDTGTNDIAGAAEFDAVREAFLTWAEAVPLTFVEIALDQNPDVRIGWRPAADPDHSMVGGVLAHADFPPGCSVVTTGLPKPVHFDDEEHTWSIGAVSSAFDVETVALHEIGHILGLAHSSVGGSVMFASVSSNFTKRILTADDLSGIQSLYPNPSIPMDLQPGVYTIRQKINGRYVDAHENSSADFSVVTRTAQNNDTQRWQLKPVGGIYTIQQKINGRYVDAHENSSADFSVVTRTKQDNDSQRWILMHLGRNVYTIQQKINARYMDAHENSSADFSVVTRTAASNDTLRWILTHLGNKVFTIQQKSNGRYLDAHEVESADYSVVTRPWQNNDSQRWILTPLSVFYTIQQVSNGRYMDAHEVEGADFSVVTRTAQNNDSQRWILTHVSGNVFTIQQRVNNRFLDAHEVATADFSVVTRSWQNNDSQRWLIDRV